MTPTEIRSFEVRLESLELSKPYELSFRTLDVFEAVVTRVSLSDGNTYHGEVVPLPGYGEETVEDVLGALHGWAPSLVGAEIADARVFLDERREAAPFAASAGLGALDQVDMFADRSDLARSVPLVYPVSSKAPTFEDDVQSGLDQGYRTLKIKVGFGLDADLAAIKVLERVVPRGIRLRFDANASMTPYSARTFCESVARGLAANTELVEQPFDVTMWGETEALAATTSLPIMLDEAILTVEHVERAAAVGARLIKLKLCKQGSVANVVQYARKARDLGLGVVFGNGVATDVSNRLELWAAAKFPALFAGASEANGFSKFLSPLQFEDLVVRSGEAVWR